MGKRREGGEGTVYFDISRGRWVGQAWIDGRRRKVSARTKIEAASALGKLIHGDDNERHADRRLTVAEVLADWRTKALPGRNLASTTIERHTWLCRLLTAELGKAKAANLDAQTVEHALVRLARGSQGAPLSKGSLTKARSTLSQALAWAQRRRAVAFNAAAVAELPTETAPGHDRRALSRDELQRLLEALDGHPWGTMYRCSAQLGLRPGEAAALCVDALNFDVGTLSVIRSIRLKRGRPGLVDELKTSGSRRTLTMPPSLAAALRHHIDANGIENGLLWRLEGGPLYPSTVRAELRSACAQVGIDPAIRPNELRHAFATLAADSGVAPHVLADILGHRSTKMVDEFYRHRPAIIRGAETVDVLSVIDR